MIHYKGDYGFTASVRIHRDGTATLRIWSGYGQLVHNKRHKNQKAAYAAWRRWFQ